MRQITIDFDQIKETADKGVRRAAAFLGFGVNVARDPELKNYQLSNITAFRILPDDLAEDSIRHLKEEFEKWVISNGLRELVESFALFLDHIHNACLWMALNKGKITNEDANKFLRAFERKGVEDKLASLRKRFDVKSDKEKYFASINQARNCITHRNGRVGAEDLHGEASFRLVWWGLDMFVETPSGEKHSLMPPLPVEGIHLEDGGNVLLQVNDRIIEHQFGEIINLSPNDLNEICILFNLTTNDMTKNALEYAKKIGVEIKVLNENIKQYH